MRAFSIVIPTLYRHNAVLRCLDSCIAQELSENLDFEVILVSSEADPILRRWIEPYLEKDTRVRYYEAQGKSVNRARNLGATLAQGKYCFFLDDDCWLENPQHLEKLWHFHEKNPQLMAVGGPYCSPADGAWVMRYYNWIANLWLDFHANGAFGEERLLGGNVSLQRKLFDGGWQFSPEIRYGGAETELFARLRESGYPLVNVPALAVAHAGGSSWSELCKKAWYQSRERALRAATKYELNYWPRLLRYIRTDWRRAFSASLALPFFLIGQFAFYYYRWKFADE